MATYICSCCGAKYEIEESGNYQCSCGKEFTFKVPPKPVQVSPAPKPPVRDIPAPKNEPPQKTVCPYCKSEIPADALKCAHCGEWITQNGPPKSKGIYLLLAFLFGNFGAAEFYLGNTVAGVVLLFLNILLIGFSTSAGPEGIIIAGIFWLGYFIYACFVDVAPKKIDPVAQNKKSSAVFIVIWSILALFIIGFIAAAFILALHR